MPSRRQRETGRAAMLGAAIAAHPREFVGLFAAAAATLTILVNALFLQPGPHPAPLFATRPFATSKPVHVPMAKPRPLVRSAEPVPAPVAAPARSEAQITADIQRELARRGFYDGTVDGIWGPKTDAGLHDFARATGTTVEAQPSEKLLHVVAGAAVTTGAPAQASAEPTPFPPARKDDAITSVIAPTPVSQQVPAPAKVSAEVPAETMSMAKPAQASPSKTVLAIQRALADFGYGQIKPSGIVDDDTRVAIENFQRSRHLPVTGEISPDLKRRLATMTGRTLEQ